MGREGEEGEKEERDGHREAVLQQLELVGDLQLLLAEIDLERVVAENHEAVDYIDFESIEVTQNRVNLGMILPSVAAGERMEEALKKIEFLQGMELEPWSANPISNTSFQRITFTFKRIER